MNQKGGKRPKWRVLDLEKEIKIPEKKVEPRGYVVSPNYKGKKTHDQNTIEVLLAKQESWERGSDFTVEGYRNLWTENATPKRSVNREREYHGKSDNSHDC